MDLFTLLAKLTLDSKDYEKALKSAEKDGKKAKLDAKGTLTATDHYTQGLNQAQNAARNFHGNASGTISAVDHYSGAIDAATRKGEQFNPNAKDDIEAEDKYSGVIDSATQKGQQFAPNASDDIEAEDKYSGAIDAAVLKGQGFDPNAEDDIDVGTDHYSAALDTATKKGSEFAPDASDDIDVGTDHYAAAMEADTTAAGDFEPGAEGSIGLTDDAFATAMSDDEAAASTFGPEPSGDIALGDDAFAAAMSADETAAGTFDPDADGSIGLTEDSFADALADDISDAASAVLDASGTIQATDDYTGDLSAAETAASTADLDAEGTITIDESDVKDSFDNATGEVTSFGTSFGDMVDGLERKLKAAGIVAAIGGITTAFRNAIHTSANYADEVDKTSKALQMSTHDYQVWEYVLGQSGATMDLVSRGWDKMDEVAAGIDWSGMTDAMGEAFDPANFDNPADLFNGMMEALAGLEDKSRRADILEALFGPRGRQFNAFLDDGLEGLARLRQEAEDLGLIMTDEDIANGVAFGDAIGRMDAALGGLRTKITGEIIPYLTEAVDLITKILTGQVEDGEIESTVSRIVTGLTSHATELVTALVNALSVAVPALISTFVSILRDPGFQTAAYNLVKTIYDAIKKGVWEIADEVITGGTVAVAEGLASTGVIEAAAELDSFLRNPLGANTNVAADQLAARRALMGEYVTTERSDAGNMQTEEMRSYITNPTSGTVEKTQVYRYEFVDGTWVKNLKEYTGSNTGTTPRYEGTIPVTDLAVLADLDSLYGTEAAAGRGSRYTGGYQPFVVPMGRGAAPTSGATGTEQSASANIPEGDTEQGWRVFLGQLAVTLGRALTAEEIQHLMDTITLPDEWEARVANVDVANGGVTVENGMVILRTVSGETLGEAPVEELTGYVNEMLGYNAKGAWDVPYDDYIARLHRDEMVLTASQAREYRDGGDENAAIVGAIQELRNDMANLRIFVGERAFGQTVVDYSGRRLHGYLGRTENRQFAGYGWG